MIWHPSDFDLALVNAGDLPAWKRYLVERHLRRCDACSEQAQGYGEVSRELRRLGQGIPETPEWLAARIVAGPTHASRHTLGHATLLGYHATLLGYHATLLGYHGRWRRPRLCWR